MRRSTPPGQPVETRIRLFFAATCGGPRGFCENDAVTVTLALVENRPRDLPPAKPRSLSVAPT